jgi:sodium/potassium/calcium exchanger 6
MNCTNDYISTLNTVLDKCNYIKQNCPSQYINTYSLYYCSFKGHIIFSIPVFILIILLLFLLLSSTSDLFLGASITKIVEIFNINQNIAALTLIAFGNGAPDIIPSLVASSDSEGVEFSLGNILGTSMFATSFVLGIVVYFGKEVEISPKMFNRDLILYIISLIFIAIIGINGKIHFIESLGFIIIYCFDIFYAIYQEKSIANKNKQNMSNFDKLMDEIEKMDQGISSLMEYQKFSNTEQKLIEEEKNFQKKKEIKDIKLSVNNSSYKKIEIELEKKMKII